MRRLAALLLALVACDADTIPLYGPGLSPEDWEMVHEAAAILDLSIDERTDPVGVVAFSYAPVGLVAERCPSHTEPGYFVAGCSADSFGCYREIWAIRDVSVTAHELGHALGLGHREGTVMARREHNHRLTTTPLQDTTMRRHLRRLGRCS